MKTPYRSSVIPLVISACASSYTHSAITLSNVTVADVTHSSFSVIWHAASSSEPRLEVFSDAAGTQNITSEFELVPFPFYGNQDFSDTLKKAGLMKLQVRGLAPGSDYFIRVHSESATDNGVWPASGLQQVTTQQENNFIGQATQLFVRVNDLNDTTGWPVFVKTSNSPYPVSALVGDTGGSDTAVINLANLYNLSGTNLQPAATEELTIDVLNEQGELVSKTLNLNFGSGFSITTVSDFNFITDVDTDGDGVPDSQDAFPNDPSETTDSDGDNVGDNADAFPNDPTESADSDGDGVGDNSDRFPNNPALTEHPYIEFEGIRRQWWLDIPGSSLDGLRNHVNYPSSPSGFESVAQFSGPDNWQNAYASKLSGVFYAPETGDYTFWVAADDTAELWLSVNDNQRNKRLIAQVPRWTDPQQWNKYPQQRSVTIRLEQGQAYYIEALHKEGGHYDHLAVAWQTPSATDITIMSEQYFLPLAGIDSDNDGVPDSVDRFPNDPLETTDTDGDGVGDNQDAFINNPNETADSDGDGVGDNRDLYPNDPTRTQNANTPLAGILWEWWDNITGRVISLLRSDSRYPDNPTGSTQLDEFAGPSGWGDAYASRISGVFYAPETGEYTFWVSGDDQVELWLSSNNQSANKQLIAQVPSWTDPLDWDKYPQQQSQSIVLQQGQAYYIETLHKESGSSDHVAVGWLRPSATQIEVLSADYFWASRLPDADGDGVADSVDQFPNDPTETIDTDGDGVGDNADRFPLDPSEQNDTDNDGVGDNTDAYPNDPSLTRYPNIPLPGIHRQWWLNIEGSTIESLRLSSQYPAMPSGSETRATFNSPVNWGGSYGTRISGVFYAPETGAYRFMVAGDDQAELWLSTNNKPSRKRLIAQVPGWTSPTEWDKYPQQQSSLITLRAGQAYYMEAVHKESGGEDHIAVAWMTPSETTATVIPATAFTSPATTDRDKDGVDDTVDDFPDDPQETIDTDSDGVGDNADDFPQDSSEALDSDGDGVGDNADAYPNDPERTDYPYFPAQVITREIWNGISGLAVSDLTADMNYPLQPSSSQQLTAFDIPRNTQNNYGSRISGVIYAPETGDYTFWVAGDDSVELWLSSNNNADNKRLIASVPAWTAPRQWDKYPQQQSVSITLQAGQAYYLEALHKESGGDDHISIAWLRPSGIDVEIITNQFVVSPAIIDTDHDGVDDTVDDFPLDPTETIDTDADGVGDNADNFPFDDQQQ